GRNRDSLSGAILVTKTESPSLHAMKILRTILMATLVFVCLINAAQALWSSYHMPLLEPGPILRREASFRHAREVLNGLGISRISYVAGPGGDISDGEKHFEN